LATQKSQRLSASDTRRLLDDYLRYRFGRAMSPSDFAKQAGVSTGTIDDLFAQKLVSDPDLKRIAQTIDVSVPLLEEIAGFRDMSPRMLQTLDRFFGALGKQQAGQKKAA